MASSRDPGDHGGCPELRRGPCRVLVVDDQPSCLGTARGLLTLAGYEAHTASSGADGVRVARASRPDAILLDVEMPGMDGFETCRRLKGHPATAGIPVLFCTATPDAKLDRRAFEAGAAATIGKAISPERLQNMLRVVLTTARTPARPEAAGGTRRLP